ncbi:hypothetical protein HIM_01905 [Hirsutella minnesotensis 3608]|nr:hypothetical protein HIM_01905 [Hirsutella minnesotensis 3608]
MALIGEARQTYAGRNNGWVRSESVFNKDKYQGMKGSGKQKKLAGFPKDDKIYQIKDCSHLEGQSTRENMIFRNIGPTFSTAAAAKKPSGNREEELKGALPEGNLPKEPVPLPEPPKGILKEPGRGSPYSSDRRKKITFGPTHCRTISKRDAAGCLGLPDVVEEAYLKPAEGDMGNAKGDSKGTHVTEEPVVVGGKENKPVSDKTGLLFVENTSEKIPGG